MSIFSSPQNTKYLFIDMNAYFASCEQQAHPLFRDKPVAVTPVNTPNGCIVSASYEAKKFGVKTGNLVKEAKALCPDIIVRESDTFLYLEYHKKIVDVLESFSPFLSVKSIDEAVIKLSPSEQNSVRAHTFAAAIKEKIHFRLGRYMKSSVGIGPNIFLAKQASEYQKPDGLYEIKLENLESYYLSQKLTDLKGINFRMERRFHEFGIFAPIDLFKCSNQELKEKLGAMGEYWHLKLHGFDLTDASLAVPKSIGHSHVLAPRFRNWRSAWAVLQKLAEKAGRRLRRDHLEGGGVFLGIKFLNYGGYKRGMKTENFCDSITLSRLVNRLWQEFPKEDNLPLCVGLVLFNLVKPHSRQKRLFSSYEKQENLSLAMDAVNDKYGAFTIKPASIMNIEGSAPNRIAFGRPLED